MRKPSLFERDPLLLGVVGIGITAALVLGALYFDKLPFVDRGKSYTAYFAEAGGLGADSPVQASGMRVGQVSSVDLDGPRVRVTFKIDGGLRLGDRTEAAIKTRTLLGAKILEVMPRGEGQLSGPIPEERTTSPYQLPDALGDLTTTISGLNTDELSTSLATLAETFANTPPDLKVAVEGLGRFSETLGVRDKQLRELLERARRFSDVLGKRSGQIVGLVADTNALLVQLSSQSAALDQISSNITAVSMQLKDFIGDNRETLKPALEKLNVVLTLLDDHRDDIRKSLKYLNAYAMSLGESVGSGPFFKAYLANLLPGQFVQPFVEAAFSDLGLDPSTVLPSQRTDPQTGQKATPALPMPMPRTGQGGDPRLTIPDAITGNPGDQQCGAPGAPAPGPGCYPYREPPPAPAPGGPPPGPPALPAPGLAGAEPTTPPTVDPYAPPTQLPGPDQASTNGAP
ncbi:mammalian cell entry protein [Mycobacterium sp. GA-2829]|nr:MCE family protein [Mycobacterium sp. GA-2829]KUI29337.1 mammalian cell entry protein [Mycobacterium sp. GA-2829]